MTFLLLCLVSNPLLQERSNLPNSPVTAFSPHRQWLPPYSNKEMGFVCISFIVELPKNVSKSWHCWKPARWETSSSPGPFSFSWPIIKTLLKYQCPARNERTSRQKNGPRTLKIYEAVHAFIIQWKKWSLMVIWFKVLVLSNVFGSECIPCYSTRIGNDLLLLTQSHW